ncbi:3091_t:CDS:1, partial [Paraglomus occultum]
SSSKVFIQEGIAKISGFDPPNLRNSPSGSEYSNAYTESIFGSRHGGKSDILNLGLILKEISNGEVICGSGNSKGKSFFETPEGYIELYSSCCDEDPEKRPTCEDVYKNLELLFELKMEDSSAQCSHVDDYKHLPSKFSKSLKIESDDELSPKDVTH